MLANIVEKWCLRGWYKNQKIPDLCGGAEQLRIKIHTSRFMTNMAIREFRIQIPNMTG
ncbi:hypothetical protein [Endozoicomonas sp. SCSIO W0465]|uniref:hypothetical protein n=1 Tax=Endozoicomonas sp. SCSIO W0465 TaxID=2918516 RepID=UPI002074FCDE|nr:hypothetical protein [Endozoicomonas sp. SCSIO W0465]USE38384.1 hypothetical protein MJO57_09570 [Endozoicomonas sp. SCSIO W0465]